jgi:hypothetical protein
MLSLKRNEAFHRDAMSRYDWVTYPAQSGPGRGKHLVFLTGDEGVVILFVKPRSACLLPRANALENGMIALKHRESERKVSEQRLLFVAKVHVSFPRFGEAIPEQCGVQARGGSITCDRVRRKGAEAIDERRDCGLPTGRILGIQPTVHYFSKLDSSVRSDLQHGEADHSL